MYNVAICEDEPVFAQTLEAICRKILEGLHIEYRITLFPSSEAFLNVVTKGHESYDIILLDVIMDGIDGITLAHKIREIDKNAVIIFISNYDYALQSYDVNAFHRVYFNGKLTDLLTLLPLNHFVRCHQSFVVNMNHIFELTRNSALAANGKELPISRTYMDLMK